FQSLKGVHKVVSGYSGGHVENPTYEQICTKTTGHAEVIQIEYDPSVITFAELLEVFWRTHDPTTPDQQGNDRGPQYRSAIFYHDDEQQRIAEASKAAAEAAGLYDDPIVTEISPLINFYEAEGYHQDFYRQNGNYPYCRYVIDPKMAKFRKEFAERLG
ncbi:MAG: peptide-methionine (S)-S-oxide reductase MsrA, partial [Bacteroidota bacterium]